MDFDKVFYKKINKISKLNDKEIELLEALYVETVKYSEGNSVSDDIWHTLGMEFFFIRRYEQAVEIMLRAVKEGEKLSGEERKYLGPIYGDLAMIYEHMDRYDDAYKCIKKAIKNREKSHGKNHIFTRMEREHLKKIKKFMEYTTNEKLNEEFLDFIDKDAKHE